jgi:hypothetical protein
MAFVNPYSERYRTKMTITETISLGFIAIEVAVILIAIIWAIIYFRKEIFIALYIALGLGVISFILGSIIKYIMGLT